MATAGQYISGHHDSVLASHRWRTVYNSAAYLLPALDAHLKHLQATRPSQPPTFLDIGCGPGTITLDFARILAPYGGHVTGLDPSESVVAKAQQEAADQNITNVTFTTGDAMALAFNDGSFDVIHTHQVLQHITDPVKALREQRRVCAKGGLVASRETDFSALAWWPLDPGLEAWRQMWQRVARDNGNDPDTGRRLVSLCLQAGFTRDQVQATAGTWCYSSPEERAFWGGMWQERLKHSDFAKAVIGRGFGIAADLEDYARAYKVWAEAEDGWMVFVHGEVVCRN